MYIFIYLLPKNVIGNPIMYPIPVWTSQCKPELHMGCPDSELGSILFGQRHYIYQHQNEVLKTQYMRPIHVYELNICMYM